MADTSPDKIPRVVHGGVNPQAPIGELEFSGRIFYPDI
jgi:hypothetical protein